MYEIIVCSRLRSPECKFFKNDNNCFVDLQVCSSSYTLSGCTAPLPNGNPQCGSKPATVCSATLKSMSPGVCSNALADSSSCVYKVLVKLWLWFLQQCSCGLVKLWLWCDQCMRLKTEKQSMIILLFC